MVRSILHLRSHSGCGDDLTEAFARLSVFEQASCQPGFRDVELLRPPDGGDEVIVTATWDDVAAYEAWRTSAVAADLAKALEPLVLATDDPLILTLHAKRP